MNYVKNREFDAIKRLLEGANRNQLYEILLEMAAENHYSNDVIREHLLRGKEYEEFILDQARWDFDRSRENFREDWNEQMWSVEDKDRENFTRKFARKEVGEILYIFRIYLEKLLKARRTVSMSILPLLSMADDALDDIEDLSERGHLEAIDMLFEELGKPEITYPQSYLEAFARLKEEYKQLVRDRFSQDEEV